MKKHLTILLVASMYPYAAFALLSSALDTASDITSETAHAASETAGDIVDAGLDVSVGTAQDIIGRPYYGSRYGYGYTYGPARYESPLIEEEAMQRELND